MVAMCLERADGKFWEMLNLWGQRAGAVTASEAQTGIGAE